MITFGQHSRTMTLTDTTGSKTTLAARGSYEARCPHCTLPLPYLYTLPYLYYRMIEKRYSSCRG